MKQLFNSAFLLSILIGCAMLLPARASATVHTVSVADFAFSPSSMTIHLGDTVRWVWASGSHTTTSVTVPSGAAAWDQPIATSGASFTYVPAVVGTYSYKCTPHSSMGMVGSFTVVSPTLVTTPGEPSITVFPNPASEALNVKLNNPNPASLTILSVQGKEMVRSSYVMQNTAIDLRDVPNGLYFVRIAQSGMVYDQKLIIMH